jgi:hypothetical protein
MTATLEPAMTTPIDVIPIAKLQKSCDALKKWYATHPADAPLPPRMQKHDEVVKAGGLQGRANTFIRLVEQCEATHSKLPAATYAEAIRNLKMVAAFPRFVPGEEASARTRECLMPLFIDLFHLACILAEEGDDLNSGLKGLL